MANTGEETITVDTPAFEPQIPFIAPTPKRETEIPEWLKVPQIERETVPIRR